MGRCWGCVYENTTCSSCYSGDSGSYLANYETEKDEEERSVELEKCKDTKKKWLVIIDQTRTRRPYIAENFSGKFPDKFWFSSFDKAIYFATERKKVNPLTDYYIVKAVAKIVEVSKYGVESINE